MYKFIFFSNKVNGIPLWKTCGGTVSIITIYAQKNDFLL